MVRLGLAVLSRFKYFQRYVDHETFNGYRVFRPIRGWLTVKYRKGVYYDEHRPWTHQFKSQNNPYTKNERYIVEPIKPEDFKFFLGDRVEILVGKDKGKQGIINSIIHERNWCFVEGLNCEYQETAQQVKGLPPLINAMERPLLVTRDVKLVDPSTNEAADVEWRYTKKGDRVRVCMSTGRILPTAQAAKQLDDFVHPDHYVEQDKDTKADEVTKVTFVPKLKTFEADIMEKMGIKEDRKRAKMYYY